MEIKEAIEKSEQSKDVQKIKGKNYFLASCFCIPEDDIIKEWTLHFFNPRNKRVIDCFITDTVTIGEETPAINAMKELDLSEARITASDALNKAKKRYNKKAVKVLISLHTKEKTVWTINMIGQSMIVNSYDIDAKTGEIIKEEQTSLLR